MKLRDGFQWDYMLDVKYVYPKQWRLMTKRKRDRETMKKNKKKPTKTKTKLKKIPFSPS